MVIIVWSALGLQGDILKGHTVSRTTISRFSQHPIDVYPIEVLLKMCVFVMVLLLQDRVWSVPVVAHHIAKVRGKAQHIQLEVIWPATVPDSIPTEAHPGMCH